MMNPIWHWELMVEDVAKAKAFYGKIFGWKFDAAAYPGYTLIDTGAPPGGGMIKRPPESPHTALSMYFRVDDITRTLRTVVENGGTVIVPRTEIPSVGWIAMFLDPDRIPVGILQPVS